MFGFGKGKKEASDVCSIKFEVEKELSALRSKKSEYERIEAMRQEVEVAQSELDKTRKEIISHKTEENRAKKIAELKEKYNDRVYYLGKEVYIVEFGGSSAYETYMSLCINGYGNNYSTYKGTIDEASEVRSWVRIRWIDKNGHEVNKNVNEEELHLLKTI